MAVGQPSRERGGADPDCGDGAGGDGADGSALRPRRRAAMLGQDGRRDQPDGQENAEGHKDDVVEVAENGNEIRNEIDGRERISGDQGGHCLGVPGYAWIASGKIERVHLAPKRPRPALEVRHWASATVPRPPAPGGTARMSLASSHSP